MKATPWRVLDRTVLLDHPRMQIVEDTVELPDGKITTYIRNAPTRTHAVAVIALNDNDEILLQREYSYPPDKILWQLPGGGMLEDEDVIVAANRELSEESNMVAKTCTVAGSFYMNNRRTDIKQYVVVGTALETKLGQRDEEEFIESIWVPVSKLKDMVAAGELENVNLLAALYMWECIEKRVIASK